MPTVDLSKSVATFLHELIACWNKSQTSPAETCEKTEALIEKLISLSSPVALATYLGFEIYVEF